MSHSFSPPELPTERCRSFREEIRQDEQGQLHPGKVCDFETSSASGEAIIWSVAAGIFSILLHSRRSPALQNRQRDCPGDKACREGETDPDEDAGVEHLSRVQGRATNLEIPIGPEFAHVLCHALK